MNDLLQEFCDSRGVTMRVDRQAGVIRGVKILGLHSRNGRQYPAETLAKADQLGLSPADFLHRHDSYHFFLTTGGLLQTGLTETNVATKLSRLKSRLQQHFSTAPAASRKRQ